MASTAISDPYKVLGVDAFADSAAIKKAYRKLVLSCHPDKVTDQSLKAQKQEEFHQIQQAYETIGDPENRSKYELELKAKRLREERERAASKGSPAQPRNVNINIYHAQHPAEHRSSSTKYSPSKPPVYKPYSAAFSKSWDHSIPTRSKEAYEAERNTRRTYSDERLNDESKERRRRHEDRERKRRQDEDDERRRRQAKMDKEAALERERARARDAARRKELEREERNRAKARERAAAERESKRRQEAADEKVRARMRPHEHTSEEDDDRRSRAKKPMRKDSPRDKTPSKPRERSGPRVDAMPAVPNTADPLEAMESRMAYAALYIRDQQTKKNKSSSPKNSSEAPVFTSDAYPDPNKWVPKRRVSGDKTTKATAEPASMDTNGSTPITPSASQGPPPRLKKAYTMDHVPTSDARPPALGRAQTFEAEAFTRSMGSSSDPRPRITRHRTAMDEDDFYSTPRVSKYSVGREKGLPRVFETTAYRDQYAPGGTFPKVKLAQAYGNEHVNHSKRYDREDITFADYPTASQQAYVAAHT